MHWLTGYLSSPLHASNRPSLAERDSTSMALQDDGLDHCREYYNAETGISAAPVPPHLFEQPVLILDRVVAPRGSCINIV